MKNLFYWSVRGYFLLLVLMTGFSYLYRPDPSFYKNLAIQRSGDMVSKEWFPVSSLDLLWQSVSGFLSLFYLILPFVVIALLLTTKATTKAIKIWKWITSVALLVVMAPFGLIFVLTVGREIAGVPFGLAFAPLILFGMPSLVISVIGLLISEWVARSRPMDTNLTVQGSAQSQPPL